MRILTLVLAAIVSLWPVSSFAKNTHQTCRIVIRQVSSSGQKGVIRFDSILHSYQECTQLAKLHEPIFEPAHVVQKQVYFRWYR